jgi:predicted nucleic acid-binding protein
LNLFIDSSVWIDYFNGVQTSETDFLDSSLGKNQIFVGDLILVEVLQGFRLDKDFDAAYQALTKFRMLAMVNQSLAVQSTSNYRALRKKGITIRKTIDCMIATFCIENNLTLLHSDRDFIPFAQHLKLMIWQPSL